VEIPGGLQRMKIKRIFLDWHRPCLWQAADWLLEQASGPEALDLANATLVVSGSRAGRRLLEILVERSAGKAMTPPQIITLSSLPEKLYPPQGRLADELSANMLMAEALRLCSSEELKPLLRYPPRKEDVIGLLSVAGEIQALAQELARHQLSFHDVAEKSTTLIDYDDQQRWQVLSMLQNRYEMVLRNHGLQDPHLARRQAMEQGRLSHPGPVVLIATSDLAPLHQAMLQLIDGPVYSLIHAPADLQDTFDDAGVPIVSEWETRSAGLKDSNVHLMGRPLDQAYHVVQIISDLEPAPQADQITVGLGDPRLGPLVGRTLSVSGVPSRLATGQMLSQSPPAVLLDQLAHLLTRQTTRELAMVFRCPPVEARIRQAMGEQSRLLLTHLDRYIDRHLPQPLQTSWLGEEEEHRVIATAYQTLMSFLPEDWHEQRPLSHWTQVIAQLLAEFFGQRPLDRFNEEDAQLIRAIQCISEALRQQQEAPHSLPLVQRFTLPQAITLLLMQMAGQMLPPEAGEPAVELLGWLELQLDDAPNLIITGFNEGNIPQNVNHHWLLPDAFRQALGLMDNRHRFARDLYMLSAICHSRPVTHVILGRTTSQGDPLAPSRLLLSNDPCMLPHWIDRFYDEKHGSPRAPLLLTPGRVSTFDVPRPVPLDEPVTELTVTAFRQYIACPYRFYLKYVLGLQAVNDQANEMNAQVFGNMAHAVLGDFAACDLVRSENPRDIETWLTDRLHDLIRESFGSQPPAVIHVQEEILRQRMVGFSRWQANQNRQGWFIDSKRAERSASTVLEVDGEPFKIRGRIDRCDHHDTYGYRLLDYKTGEDVKPPSKTHLDAEGNWIDLQLPLYHELTRGWGLNGPVELGYIALPKDLKKIELKPAQWTAEQLESAMDKTREIIRNIREEKFWPPATALREDEFSSICMDRCLNRKPLTDDVLSGGVQ